MYGTQPVIKIHWHYIHLSKNGSGLTVGHLWIFPNWLHHQVYPFFWAGERLSIAMNWNVHDSDEQLLLGKSEEQKKEFYEFQEAQERETDFRQSKRGWILGKINYKYDEVIFFQS